jgi:hypothetical protein
MGLINDVLRQINQIATGSPGREIAQELIGSFCDYFQSGLFTFII